MANILVINGSYRNNGITDQVIGANSIGTLFTGLVAKDPQHKLSGKVQEKARTLAVKLL